MKQNYCIHSKLWWWGLALPTTFGAFAVKREQNMAKPTAAAKSTKAKASFKGLCSKGRGPGKYTLLAFLYYIYNGDKVVDIKYSTNTLFCHLIRCYFLHLSSV